MRQSRLRVVVGGIVMGLVAWIVTPGSSAQSQPPKPPESPAFVNIADDVGLGAPYSGYQTRFADLDGDGWLDILLKSRDGMEFKQEFLARNKLTAADLLTPIAKSAWRGDPEEFNRADVDGDGALSQADLDRLARMNQVWHFRSIPRSDGKPGRAFLDITASSGIRANLDGKGRGRHCYVFVVADVDDDGDRDLFSGGYDVATPGNTVWDRPCLLLNDGKGVFSAYAQPLPVNDSDARGPNADLATLAAATFLDFDRDGKLDLFVGNWYTDWGTEKPTYDCYPDRLYQGQGNGTFRDISTAAGLLRDMSAAAVLTAEERRGAVPLTPERRALVGRKSNRPTYGVAACDWDNDGDQDLFVMAYGRQWNLHWRNNGDGTFTEIGEGTHFDGDDDESGTYSDEVKRQQNRRDELPYRSNGNTFACDFGDYDNNGTFDAILGEYTHAWAGPSSDLTRLLTNRGATGNFAFRNESPDVLPRKRVTKNWNQGDIAVAFADFDNDGLLDVLIAAGVYPDDQRLLLYRQIPGGKPGQPQFVELAETLGLNWPDAMQFSLGDFDRDGDLDILIGNQPHEKNPKRLPRGVALFRNDWANRNGNHFISLRLTGKGWRNGGSNREAIGARILVTAGGITHMREVKSSHGHMGQQDDTRVIIGLGKADKVDRVEIRWPKQGAAPQVFTDLAVNRFYEIVEGADALRSDAGR